VIRARRIATLACAALLALPGAALAGGAGDDQYEDPFAEEGAPSEQPAQTQQREQAPAPAPAEPEPAGDAGVATPEVEPGGARSAAPTLPRTGADAGLLAAGGAALVLAGVALRRRGADALPD